MVVYGDEIRVRFTMPDGARVPCEVTFSGKQAHALILVAPPVCLPHGLHMIFLCVYIYIYNTYI